MAKSADGACRRRDETGRRSMSVTARQVVVSAKFVRKFAPSPSNADFWLREQARVAKVSCSFACSFVRSCAGMKGSQQPPGRKGWSPMDVHAQMSEGPLFVVRHVNVDGHHWMFLEDRNDCLHCPAGGQPSNQSIWMEVQHEPQAVETAQWHWADDQPVTHHLI